MGYWLSVGFGKTVMRNSDIILCQYKYTGNTATDKFLCSDRNATGYFLPTLDAVDNCDDISTGFTMTTVGNQKTAQLTVVFERDLDTLDLVNDFRMKKDQTIDAIWAHGQILGNTPQSHGSLSTSRGSYRMFIPGFDSANFGIRTVTLLVFAMTFVMNMF